jgi:hypothetical protein
MSLVFEGKIYFHRKLAPGLVGGIYPSVEGFDGSIPGDGDAFRESSLSALKIKVAINTTHTDTDKHTHKKRHTDTAVNPVLSEHKKTAGKEKHKGVVFQRTARTDYTALTGKAYIVPFLELPLRKERAFSDPNLKFESRNTSFFFFYRVYPTSI